MVVGTYFGGSSYSTLTSIPNPANGVTFGGWFRFEAAIAGALAFGSSADSYATYSLFIDTGNVFLYDSNSGYIGSPFTLAQSTWAYIVLKWTNATTVSLGYITTPGGAITWADTDLAVTARTWNGISLGNNGFGYPMTGTIEYFSVFDSALSDATISANSNTSAPAGAWASIRCESGDATTDSSGNSRNFTLTGTVSASTYEVIVSGGAGDGYTASPAESITWSDSVDTLIGRAVSLSDDVNLRGVSVGAIGAVAYSAAAGSTVAPSYAALGAIDPTTDIILLCTWQKPSSANGGTITTPTGFTLVSANLAKGGYNTTLGAGTGNTNLRWYKKDTVTGSESGTLSISLGTNSVTGACFVRLVGQPGLVPIIDGYEGFDSSGNNSLVVTGGSINYQAGDILIGSFCYASAVSSFTNQALSSSGITFGTVIEDIDSVSTNGNDVGAMLCHAVVTDGYATGTTTMTSTAGGTVTNVRGPGTLLRIRSYTPFVPTFNWSDAIGVVYAPFSGSYSESIAESITWSDSIGVVGGSITYSANVSESVSISDNFTSNSSFTATPNETITISEGILGQLVVPSSKIQINLLRPGIPNTHIGYAKYTNLHFKDNVTGDLVWFVSNSAQDTVYIWTQQGELPASQVASSGVIGGWVSSAQDSVGNVHATVEYGGGISYCKISLTRAGGHVTGWSFGTVISLPAMTSPLNAGTPDSWGGTVTVANNGNGVERVFIGKIDGNSAAQYCAAVCHTSLTPSATTDFVSLAGTSNAWTKFPTQTSTNTAVAAPYCFNIAIEPYGTSGNLFVVAGASSRGDVNNYGCSLVGYRALASGANWTPDTGNPCTLAGNNYETLLGQSCPDSSGNAYIAWSTRADQGIATVALARIAVDGTFTASIVSTTFAYGGEVRVYPFVTDDNTIAIICDPGVVDVGVTQHRELKVYSNGTWYSYWVDSGRAPANSYTSRGGRGWLNGIVWHAGDDYYPSPLALGAVSYRTGFEIGVLFDNYSLPAYSTSATLAPTYATAIPSATKDMHVFIVGQKPTVITGGTISFPAGFTKQGEILGAGGYASQGSDTGNVDIAVATKDSVAGSETGSISVTLGSTNVSWGMSVRLTKAGDGYWDFASATGSDTTGGAAVSITYGSAVTVAPGDLIIVGFAIPTDVTTPRQFTSPSLTASGITFSECMLINEPYSASGNGIGGVACYARVLSGTGTATITFSATAGGTTTNVRGGSVLLRARELPSTMQYFADVSESLTLGDSTGSLFSATPTISELLTMSELADFLVSNTQNVSEFFDINVLSQINALYSSIFGVSESILLSDGYTVSKDSQIGINESIVLSELSNIKLSSIPALSDTITLNDSSSISGNLNIGLSESSSISATSSQLLSAVISATDSLTLSDNIQFVRLPIVYSPIDTSLSNLSGWISDGTNPYNLFYFYIDESGVADYHANAMRLSGIGFSSVSSAVLTIPRFNDNNGANGTVRIRLEASNNPAAYSASNSPSTRAYRSAYVDYNLPADGYTVNIDVTPLLQDLLSAGYTYNGTQTISIVLGTSSDGAGWGSSPSVSWRSTWSTQNSPYLTITDNGTLYNIDVPETININDSLSAIYNAISGITESRIITESVFVTRPFSASINETLTISELPNISASIFTGIAESLTLTDSSSASQQYTYNVSEAISISETVQNNFSYGTALSETITLNDVINYQLQFNFNLNEFISISDEASYIYLVDDFGNYIVDDSGNNIIIGTAAGFDVVAHDNVNISEQFLSTELSNIVYSITSSLSETINYTESQTSLYNSIINATENIYISEDTLSILNDGYSQYSINVSEEFIFSSITNTQNSLTLPITEIVSIADSLNYTYGIIANVTDNISFTDGYFVSLGINSGIQETITLSDAYSLRYGYAPNIYESVNITDAVYIVTNILLTISESLSISELATALINQNSQSYAANISESLSIVEIILSVFSYREIIQDIISYSELINSSALINGFIYDSVSLLESISLHQGLSFDLNETISINDTAILLNNFNSTLSELVTINESTIQILSTIFTIQEILSVNENINIVGGRISYISDLVESIIVDENSYVFSNFINSINDPISITDQIYSYKGFSVNADESISINEIANLTVRFTENLHEIISIINTIGIINSYSTKVVCNPPVSITTFDKSLHGLRTVMPHGDGNTVTLEWHKAYLTPRNWDLTYNIYWSTKQSDVFSEVKFALKPTQTTSYLSVDVAGFIPGKTYFFAVKAAGHEPGTLAFNQLPDGDVPGSKIYPESALRSNISYNDQIIPVTDASIFPPSGIVQIGGELISYSNVDVLDGYLFNIERGVYGYDTRIHTVDGYDGIRYYDNIFVRLWRGWEDSNTAVGMLTINFDDKYARTILDGYRERVDILSGKSNLNVVDASNVGFPSYDQTGWDRTFLPDYLSGKCIGTYFGGEYGCADGDEVKNSVRGLSVQDHMNMREEYLLQTTGEPVVLFRRSWSGKQSLHTGATRENTTYRGVDTYGTSLVSGYEQYFNPRQSDGKILVRFGPTKEDFRREDAGIENLYIPNCWTLVTPTIKDGDFIIRFNQDGTEEWRYEVIDVERNRSLLQESGAQKFTAVRVRKTDPIYQVRSIRDTSTMPREILTSIGTVNGPGGIPPHMHRVVISSDKMTSISQINQLTSVDQGHNHSVINGIVQNVLGHSHIILPW